MRDLISASFECLRRDVEIARQLRERLALDHREGHLALLGRRLRGLGRLRLGIDYSEVRLHR
jgi:hypothetical protein